MSDIRKIHKFLIKDYQFFIEIIHSSLRDLQNTEK